jgi:hypothetical protein
MAVFAIGNCEGGDGPNLSGFVNLVYAPDQWGKFVACHSNGASAADVAALANSASAREAANRFGISLAEVSDSVRYVASQQ